MLVLGWVTAEEQMVLLATAGRFASPVIPCVWEAKITGHYWWSLLVITAGWEVCISCNPVRLGGRGYITECDSEEYALKSCVILCGANEKHCLTVTVRRQSSCYVVGLPHTAGLPFGSLLIEGSFPAQPVAITL